MTSLFILGNHQNLSQAIDLSFEMITKIFNSMCNRLQRLHGKALSYIQETMTPSKKQIFRPKFPKFNYDTNFWKACICSVCVSLAKKCLAKEIRLHHYNDVTMSTIASQITSLTIVYSAIYSDADERKHQSSTSLAFVRGIHRVPVNFPHKWPVTWKMFPSDDVIMWSNSSFFVKFINMCVLVGFMMWNSHQNFLDKQLIH